MQSSIHEAPDARLLAIHSESLKIKGFASYSLVLPFHNKPAHLKKKAYPPNRMAWDMCVIENMTAKEPLQISSSTLGTVTEPLSWTRMTLQETISILALIQNGRNRIDNKMTLTSTI
jgi:hypothetical protein